MSKTAPYLDAPPESVHLIPGAGLTHDVKGILPFILSSTIAGYPVVVKFRCMDSLLLSTAKVTKV